MDKEERGAIQGELLDKMTNGATPSLDDFPWLIELGMSKWDDTYLVHHVFGPVAAVKIVPNGSLEKLTENVKFIQKAFDCICLCRQIWGDGYEEELKKLLSKKPD